jgi:hypothetical protein
MSDPHRIPTFFISRQSLLPTNVRPAFMSMSKPWYLADYILPDEKRCVGLQHVKAA